MSREPLPDRRAFASVPPVWSEAVAGPVLSAWPLDHVPIAPDAEAAPAEGPGTFWPTVCGVVLIGALTVLAIWGGALLWGSVHG